MTKDNISKEYMKDNERFADLFNFYLYDGKSIIKDKDLIEIDTNDILNLENKYNITRYRDIVKKAIIKYSDNITYALILGLENQTEINYAMVIRNMVYDSITYQKQIEALNGKSKYGKIKYEVLEKEKLKPVITLVLYFGNKKWNGPKDLYSMFEDSNTEIRKYVSNYKLNLITPYDLEEKEFDKFKTEIKLLLKYIKYSNNKKELEKISKDKEFERVSKDTANTINVMTGSKLNIEEKEGEINMCKAIDDMRKEERKEGREEGRMEERAKTNKRDKETVFRMSSLGVSKEDIAKYLGLNINKVTRILKEKLA